MKAAKAVFALVVGFLTSLTSVLISGESLGQIDAKSWLTAVLAGLILGGGVYGISNQPQ